MTVHEEMHYCYSLKGTLYVEDTFLISFSRDEANLKKKTCFYSSVFNACQVKIATGDVHYFALSL